MQEFDEKSLRGRLDEKNCNNLLQLHNPKLHAFVSDAIELCNPASVFICTDAPEDIEYIRKMATRTGEEKPLATEGHTVHFDGYNDQGRDKENTKYLIPPHIKLGKTINAMDKAQGIDEVRGLLKNSMAGRQMIVRFLCLGPTGSDFSISCVQITDSFYVAHSESLLYRPGFEEFRRLGDSGDFFRLFHSSGRLVDGVSADHEKRRIYIDIEENIVYSVNTQYAGNTVGLKKLSLRLTIRNASNEGWLAEHMFVMGIPGPQGRKTYFAGAFPSACGKTSTATIRGTTIIGDDIAYLRKYDGIVRAANAESGIFGIISDVNAKDDPALWEVLTRPGEVIFSNVLVSDGRPYWLGMGCDIPGAGVNYSGEWFTGKTDAEGNEIPPAHKNARYTIKLLDLASCDENLDNPMGVPLSGIIYGGRDSDTWVPVQQSFDWAHGVITMGASLESETTAAILGKEGVRKFNLMSNLDFLSIPIPRYIKNHLDFVRNIENPPLIFAVNYFLKNKGGKYITGMDYKRVWVKWLELRVHNEAGVIRTPTGLYPEYESLRGLFKEILGRDYSKEEYVEQFMIRIPENLGKISRIMDVYRNQVSGTPQIVFDVLEAQAERLKEIRAKHGDYVSPLDLER